MKYLSSAVGGSILAASMLLTGCASMFSSSKHDVGVVSSPVGANYEVRNKAGVLIKKGTTPDGIKLSASAGYFIGESYTVRFSKEGHSDQVVTLTSGINGWYWGNILIGGVIGMLVIDPLTGAMYTLPKSVTGNLSQASAPAPSAPETLGLQTLN
jgi:hypothetical protein